MQTKATTTKVGGRGAGEVQGKRRHKHINMGVHIHTKGTYSLSSVSSVNQAQSSPPVGAAETGIPQCEYLHLPCVSDTWASLTWLRSRTSARVRGKTSKSRSADCLGRWVSMRSRRGMIDRRRAASVGQEGNRWTARGGRIREESVSLTYILTRAPAAW